MRFAHHLLHVAKLAGFNNSTHQTCLATRTTTGVFMGINRRQLILSSVSAGVPGGNGSDAFGKGRNADLLVGGNNYQFNSCLRA